MRRLFPSGAGQRLRVGGAVPPPRKGAAMDGLFERRKPVEAIIADSRAAGEGDAHQLKRAMGVWGITALGIGAIVGTGIFVLTGHAAATSAGPGIVISFVIAGIVSALAALCYAELASTVPVSGSAYTYVYATLGEFIAWIVGWGLILEYALGAATVAIGWSGYFGDFLHATFGLTIPRAYSTNPFEGGVANVPAAVIILLISFLLIRGTQESNTVNKVIVCVKLAVVAFFIFIGIGHVNPANWHPFAPFGIKGIVNGAGLVFFAYIGFDAVSTSAEEVKNPERDLPRGIIGSLAVCTVLYILVSGILTGILPYSELNVASPVSYSLIKIGLGWAGAIVAVGAIAGLTTVLLVMLYGQSRVFFAMSRDGLLPAVFSKVHPTFRTPYLSSALIGIVVAVVAAVAELDVVADLVNIGTLAAFALVSIGVVVLRRRSPDLKRGFRVPFSPVVPIVSAVAAVALIFNGLPLRTIEAYVIWLVIGLGVYFGYSRRNSKLHA
jgi:APA family basic amino acid/polyamine antiporter